MLKSGNIESNVFYCSQTGVHSWLLPQMDMYKKIYSVQQHIVGLYPFGKPFFSFGTTFCCWQDLIFQVQLFFASATFL